MIVRIILLNYNTVELTLKCVDYILRQKGVNSHILVVDNGSLKEVYDELKIKLPNQVKIIRFENNAGFAAGNNRGCGHVEGLPNADYYLFINSDAFLTQPNSIKELLDELKQNPNAVAISPLVHTMSNAIPVRFQIQVRRIMPPGWLVVCQSPILRRLPYIKDRYFKFIYRNLVPYQKKVYKVDTINGAIFMIQSTFLHQIGLLDSGTFLYMEELVLGAQIRKENKQCLLYGGIIVPHIQGATSGGRNGKINRKLFAYFIESEAYFLRKYYKYSSATLFVIRLLRLFEFFIKSILHYFNNKC